MEAVNHEYYVSFEVAKLLKEAGFDWEVQSYYSKLSKKQERLLWLQCGCNYKENINTNQNRYSAPTLDVAQRWLREVKRIFIHVSVYAVTEQGPEITDNDKFSIYAETWDSQKWDKWVSLFEIDDFNTYEEAQEAGIKKVLEIILKKVK